MFLGVSILVSPAFLRLRFVVLSAVLVLSFFPQRVFSPVRCFDEVAFRIFLTRFQGATECESDRSREELSNEYFVAKSGSDTAVDESI